MGIFINDEQASLFMDLATIITIKLIVAPGSILIVDILIAD